MTKAEAAAELELVEVGYKALYEAAEEAGGGCWWCCGGGDEWLAELQARESAALTALSWANSHHR